MVEDAGIIAARIIKRKTFTQNDWQGRKIVGLAAKIGIDRQGLVETVARFNGFARAGKDFDFDRGYSAYERYMGDMVSPVSGPGGTVGPGMACLAGIHAAGEAHKQK